MIYPENFEIKTGFDRIRAKIESFCLSEMGKKEVVSIVFSDQKEKIFGNLKTTDEFRRILISGIHFPSQDYYDLREEFSRLKIEGTYIEIEKLLELQRSLITISNILHFFTTGGSELYPGLYGIIAPAAFDETLITLCEKMVDDKGNIRDNASPELKVIRREQIKKAGLVEKRLRQIFVSLKKEGITHDEAEITIRSGRSVIPLPAANKRRIRGFIHDESATGQTVYIEPEEIFDLNNELRELESAEKREIIRILTSFTDELRPSIHTLLGSYKILAITDMIRAKAKLSLEIKAVLPRILEKEAIDFKSAINPILFLTNQKTGKKVIPLDIKLDNESRILVISGPNAGGKSVCLKTTGLLQYMLQCGLLIPVREDSETGIFSDIFIEIGDEQSIENDLSTYSSHLSHVRYLLEVAGNKTLFLIDEFGSGTEPQAGGAIAEAVLENLSTTGALGVITTHYLNLKLMAGKVAGIVNGAMLFDSSQMAPMYQLVIGQPGSSFAFEIAGKIGFPPEILEAASQKTGTSAIALERQLNELETERRQLEKQKLEFTLADDMLASLIQRYEDLNEKIALSRKQILDQAKEDAKDLLDKTNRAIENTIRSIKESQADKEITKLARIEIAAFSKSVADLPTDEPMEEIKPTANKKNTIKKPILKKEKPKNALPLIAGGFAIIKGQNTPVEILDIKGTYAMIINNNIHLKISLDQLEATDRKPADKSTRKSTGSYNSITNQINDKLAQFKTVIDFRGARADEIIPLIQKYIDEAILLNVSEVRILHGKGNGVLRGIIREYLRTIDEVKSFNDERLENGGDGNTIVHFR
jgi:DNA mismatch repair protein MutS2